MKSDGGRWCIGTSTGIAVQHAGGRTTIAWAAKTLWPACLFERRLALGLGPELPEKLRDCLY